jgi:isopenicillin N synthase-like dioxygenase
MAGASKLPADAVVARSDAGAVRQALSRHGFVILRDALSRVESAALARCDELALACFSTKEDELIAMRCAGSAVRRQTRQLALCSELPLAGIGLHTVSEGGERVRDQVHLVTDPAAMRLMRWPRTGRLGGLGDAVRRALHVLHDLCTGLLDAVEPAAEGARRAQAELSGDPSVLDLFLYPNEHTWPANMRTHTDPGLLTVTQVSDTPGLQVLDAATGAWLDVEAVAHAADLVLMCGESLQQMSRGATPRASRAGAPPVGRV